MVYIGFDTICRFQATPMGLALYSSRIGRGGKGGLLCFFNFISPWPKLDVPPSIGSLQSQLTFSNRRRGDKKRERRALRSTQRWPRCSWAAVLWWGQWCVLGGMAGSGPRPDVISSGQTDESRK